ncbi:MAG: ribosomal protein S18-alanine N-acetyltransferase [Candidatus Eisenbacteria sp.]|nr:ribosomal protein S18-alanine N-acetyltransferase [Candidatus Eisenbacteria bacterium]
MAAEPDELALRPMGEDDLDAVVALERACFGDPWPRACFQAEVDEAPDVRWPLVAVGPGGPAGFAIAWFIGDKVQIANLAVAPAYRRRGLGRRFLEAILAEAERRGAREIHLEVRDSNAAALALYRRIGFRIVGRRRHYYGEGGEDALLMRQDLTPGAQAEASETAVRGRGKRITE